MEGGAMVLTETAYKSTEEIQKEAESYPVITFADILRALKSHPDWLEEIRRIILTTELLGLPKKFEELLERVRRLEKDTQELKQDVTVLKQDVAVLKQDVAVLKQDVAVLKQDVAILKQDVAILKQDVAMLKQEVAILKQDVSTLKADVNYLKGEFGRFKGKEFERTVRENYFAYFGRIIRKAKLIEKKRIVSLLEEAEEKGIISEDQMVAALELDLLLQGEIKSTRKPIVLAVEISYSLYEEDLQRAMERADLLASVLKKEVIPTVVGVEIKDEIVGLAEEKGIFLLRAKYD
jgi:chromosome segregation ATPase